MPVLFKMSDDKKTENIPTIVIAETQTMTKPRSIKKNVIIAVSSIFGVAIVLTAILVGMYMFTETQKEMIKYSMQLGDTGKQDVTSDPNENVVQYHVSNPSQETWILNDFNRDIQLMKIVSEDKTNCYVSALNRTNAMDPAKIQGPDTSELKDAISLVYSASETPIPDTSFLSKTAREMCKGVSVYWLYPSCSRGSNNKDVNITNVDHQKTKRQGTYDNSPYYILNYVYYYSPYTSRYYWVPCYTGCCRKLCSCSITYSYYVSWGQIYCQWVHSGCTAIPSNPLYDYNPCSGPPGVSCPYAYYYCN